MDRCYLSSSIRGCYYCLIAKVAFITSDTSDISSVLSTKSEIIQLWHGMGMKAVGRLSGWGKNSKLKLTEFTEPEDIYRKFGQWRWMCASEEAKKKYSVSFMVPEDKFVITGEPKNDAFINYKQNDFISRIRQKKPGVKVAVYLPTHRNFGVNNEISEMVSVESLRKLDDMLDKKNITLIFKPHFHEFDKYKGYESSFSNIVFATEKKVFGDVYAFLPVCDILITDYSGIMFGYLASGKPIIYFPYDYESYTTSDAGFYYDYEDVLYGPICMNWEDVVEKMSSITSIQYEEEREKQRKRFCPYYDGLSCERVYNETIKILEETNESKR